MRNIDAELLARILNNKQSPQNNNAPRVEVIVSRATTPIIRSEYWQESIVAEGTTATCTSVAVKKAKENFEEITVAYVSGGNLTVKKALFVLPAEKMVWETVEEITGVTSCAVEYDGKQTRIGQNVEFRTDSLWLFYVLGGNLYGGILGEEYTLIASGVTTIDAVRGVRSPYGDIDQGMIIFYISSGAIKYKQFISGAWSDEQSVPFGQVAVSLKAEQLFDYRVCLQIKDSAGALWELFSKMEASAWNASEFISVGISQIVSSLPITHYDCQCSVDHITIGISQTIESLYALSPVIMSAENIDDGSGNMGRTVRLTWDEMIFGEQSNVGRFVLTDGFGGEWGAQSLVKSGKTLTITFADFNNAIGPVTLTYHPGTLMGDVVTVASDSLTFTADGLIPTVSDPPSVVSLSFPDQKHIVVNFDSDVVCGFWELTKDAFEVNGEEYDRIPDGELLPIIYEVESVAQNTTTSVLLTLTDDGRLKNPIGDVTVTYNKGFGHLVGPDGSQVLGWTLAATPTITAPIFNPNDIENITLGISQDVDNFRIYYTDTKEDENISIGITQTVINYHVNDVPN